ncbi:MAG: Ppx/GppA phosphatase family protein, partial [Candidatus Limosilactobacillus intestinavium]
MENLAIVDLGSNSARLAITRINDNGTFHEIKRVKENTRLSEGMGAEKILQPKAMNHTIAALKRFKKIYDHYQHVQVVAITTAAVRQAKNQKEFLTYQLRSIVSRP